MIRRVWLAARELPGWQCSLVLATLVFTFIGAMVLLWLFTKLNRRTI